MRDEKIVVPDGHGFSYTVTLEHYPHNGFTNALYAGSIIGQVSLGRITEPHSDDDREWEMYEERFAEWSDEIKSNIIPMCKQHFNR